MLQQNELQKFCCLFSVVLLCSQCTAKSILIKNAFSMRDSRSYIAQEHMIFHNDLICTYCNLLQLSKAMY